jgi:L-threonylcarbamoyladenylate synthase
MAHIHTNITEAVELLKIGEVVGIPTETVYGLAANALNEDAVLKIFEIKNRPKFDPLILHVPDLERAKLYADIPEKLQKLASNFWPGSLTILAPRKKNIPNIVTSGLENVAVRVPRHKLTLDLLRRIDFPLAAPSANPFGYISPTQSHHVDQQLGHKIELILEGGPCAVGLESTIVGLESDGSLRVYRKGGISVEEIEMVFEGYVVVNDHSDSDPLSPGMLKKHYSPNKNVAFWKENMNLSTDIAAESGFLCFNKAKVKFPLNQQFILSQSSDLREASQRLFEGLRFLDNLDIKYIFLESVPNIGLGLAINDRLKRAAALE